MALSKYAGKTVKFKSDYQLKLWYTIENENGTTTAYQNPQFTGPFYFPEINTEYQYIKITNTSGYSWVYGSWSMRCCIATSHNSSESLIFPTNPPAGVNKTKVTICTISPNAEEDALLELFLDEASDVVDLIESGSYESIYTNRIVRFTSDEWSEDLLPFVGTITGSFYFPDFDETRTSLTFSYEKVGDSLRTVVRAEPPGKLDTKWDGWLYPQAIDGERKTNAKQCIIKSNEVSSSALDVFFDNCAEVVPSPYVVTDIALYDIAEAIREKTGSSSAFSFPQGYADAIAGFRENTTQLHEIMNKTIVNLNDRYVTAIPDASPLFANVSSLKTVNLPACSSVGNHDFMLCSNLQTVELSSCQSLGNGAFFCCYSLESVSLPMCTRVASEAFMSCSSLSNIDLTSALTIGTGAFVDCTNLEFANIEHCSHIMDRAFSNCISLSTVNAKMCSTVQPNAFTGAGITHIMLNNCNFIAPAAFNNCQSLYEVALASCNFIGSLAFASCSILSFLYVLSTSVATLEHSNALAGTRIARGYSSGELIPKTPWICGFVVPDELYSAYCSAENWSYYSYAILSLAFAREYYVPHYFPTPPWEVV